MANRSGTPKPVQLASVFMQIHWTVIGLVGLAGFALSMYTWAVSSGSSFEGESQAFAFIFTVITLGALLGIRLAWALPRHGRQVWIAALLLEFCHALAAVSLILLAISEPDPPGMIFFLVLFILLFSALVPLGALLSASTRAHFRITRASS